MCRDLCDDTVRNLLGQKEACFKASLEKASRMTTVGLIVRQDP